MFKRAYNKTTFQLWSDLQWPHSATAFEWPASDLLAQPRPNELTSQSREVNHKLNKMFIISFTRNARTQVSYVHRLLIIDTMF